MNTTRLRTLLRLPLAAVLIAAAVALPGAQRFDGEADPQPAEVDLAVVGGLLIDGHEGPPLPGARSCSWKATVSSPSAAATS